MSNFTVAGTSLSSRLFLGTSHYPSPQILSDAVASSGTQVLTVGLRRLQPESGGGNSFWQRVQAMKCHILPNTAGCHSALEANRWMPRSTSSSCRTRSALENRPSRPMA